jgi:hypothetical protein
MINDKSSRYENEDSSFIRDFPDLFKTGSECTLEMENNEKKDSFILSNFDDLNGKDLKNTENATTQKDPNLSQIIPPTDPNSVDLSIGNPHLKKRIKKQIQRRAVNKISKEMKKCSKEYFNRVFKNQKKNALFVAKRVST